MAGISECPILHLSPHDNRSRRRTKLERERQGSWDRYGRATHSPLVWNCCCRRTRFGSVFPMPKLLMSRTTPPLLCICRARPSISCRRLTWDQRVAHEGRPSRACETTRRDQVPGDENKRHTGEVGLWAAMQKSSYRGIVVDVRVADMNVEKSRNRSERSWNWTGGRRRD